MEVPDIIERKINLLPIGYVFTCEDFYLPVEKVDALTKALSRMVVKMSGFLTNKLDKIFALKSIQRDIDRAHLSVFSAKLKKDLQGL